MLINRYPVTCISGYKQGERKFVKICDLNIGLSDFITNFVPIENSLVVVVIGYRFEPKE